MFRASKFAFVDTLVAIVSDVKIFLAFLFLTLLVSFHPLLPCVCGVVSLNGLTCFSNHSTGVHQTLSITQSYTTFIPLLELNRTWLNNSSDVGPVSQGSLCVLACRALPPPSMSSTRR